MPRASHSLLCITRILNFFLIFWMISTFLTERQKWKRSHNWHCNSGIRRGCIKNTSHSLQFIYSGCKQLHRTEFTVFKWARFCMKYSNLFFKFERQISSRAWFMHCQKCYILTLLKWMFWCTDERDPTVFMSKELRPWGWNKLRLDIFDFCLKLPIE